MKTFKKLIPFILILTLMLSYTANAQHISAMENGMPVLINDADMFDTMQTLLVKLGITDGSIEKEHIITRGEAASFAVKMSLRDITSSESPVTYFIDVAPGQKYDQEINALCSMGAISGYNGYFYPDREITAMEFASVLLKAGGFGPIIQMNGGYPAGVIKYSGDIFGGVDGLYDSITYTEAVSMMYNMLFEYVPVTETISTDGNVSYNRDRLFIEEFFGLERLEGQLVADRYAALNGRSRTDDSAVIINEYQTKTDCRYVSSPEEIHDYIGCSMEYFTNEDDNEIFWFVPTGKYKSVYVENRFIGKVNSNITEVTYSDAEDKLKTLRIKTGADFIYNGTSSFDVTASDINAKDGYTEFIDVDGNSSYDIVKIWNFDNCFVGRVSASSSRVSDINTGNAIELDSESNDYDVVIKKYGKNVEFNMLKVYDTLSIAVSNTDTGKKLITAVASDNTVEGTVDEVTDNEISIDGVVYELAPGFDADKIALRTNGMFAVNFMGEITDVYYKNANGMEYGYLIDAGKDSGLSTVAKVKLMTRDSQFVIFTMSDNFRINNIGKKTADDLINHLTDNGAIRRCLVAYKLDSDGNIKDIYTPSAEAEGYARQQSEYRLIFNRKFEEDYKFHRTYAVLDGDYHVTTAVPIFRIVTDADGDVNEKISRVINFNQLADDHGFRFNFSVYDADDDRIPGAAVLETTYDDMVSVRKYNLNTLVVDNVIDSVGLDGEVQKVIRGYLNGKKADYYCENYDISTDNINRGDMLTVMLDGTSILAYQTVFKLNCSTYTASMLFGDYAYSAERPGYSDSNDGYGHSSSRSIAIGAVTQISDKGLTIRPEGTDQEHRFIFSGSPAVYSYEGDKPHINVQNTEYIVSDTNKVMIYSRYGVVYDIVVLD